ncbi:MAG: polysaccharide pyruvyl transferase family protein [Dehalococcoidia bacterium]|nr:polysaccharide pyruvyl transferase family protein [Dehalococcoidia bacterium]
MGRRRFFVFGYYGWRNVGDDAMLFALLEELCRLDPEAEFSVLCSSEATIPSAAGGRTAFVRPTPLPVLRAILKSSVFMIGGGTHIFDYGKRSRTPVILGRILILMALSRLLGKKAVLMHNGIGPLSTRWGQLLGRWICGMAHCVVVRDGASRRQLESWGLGGKTFQAFDLAALLKGSGGAAGDTAPRAGSGKVLGVSITPVYDIYFGASAKDNLLVEQVAAAVLGWLEGNPKWRVHLIVFKGLTKDHDVAITEALRERMAASGRVKVIDYDPDPRFVLEQVAGCSAFVGMRYHSCLFAYLSGLPLLIIDYHAKCRALAQDIGLPGEAVVPLEEVLAGRLREYLDSLQRDPFAFTAKLPVREAREMAAEGVSWALRRC